MIAGPVQGAAGYATPPDALFTAMKEVLDEHGILFISDEVQTNPHPPRHQARPSSARS